MNRARLAGVVPGMRYLLMLLLLAGPALAHEPYHVDFFCAPRNYSVDQADLARCQWIYQSHQQRRCFSFLDPDRRVTITVVYPIPRRYPKNNWTVNYALGSQARLRCNADVVRHGTLRVREDGRIIYLGYQGSHQGKPFQGEVWLHLDGAD